MRRGAVTCEPAMPQNGATALVRAAFCGHADTVELLVDRGADLEAKSRVSAAAVCCCATGGAGRQGGAKGAAMALMRRALVFLSRAGVWGGRWWWGRAAGRRAMVRRGEVTCGPSAPQLGATALVLAATHGHRSTVELLLDRGADLGAKTSVSAAGM